jgi:predicted DNA-binding transcriptional regulator YafY
MRIYRVSRVQGASVTDQPAVRPPGFDLVAYWEQSSAQFKANLPRYPAIVRVSPNILDRLEYAGKSARIEQVDPPDEDGWLKITIQFEIEEQACAYVLGFGPAIEVLEPAELRQKVIKLAEGVVALYAQAAKS